MSIIQLVLAIASDLRARDYSKLVADFAALLQALANSAGKPPANEIAASLPAGMHASARPADALADECEAFAKAQGLQAIGAEKINWAGLVQLIVKLLPLIIGGL